MLTALDEKGQRFILQREHPTDYLKELRRNHHFSCEVCLSPVTLKIGEKVMPHFAHKPNTKCEGENEPESDAHRDGKWSLYQWLLNQGESPVIEQYYPAIKQRADIGLPGRRCVIEYQCSSLSPERFKERTNGYLEENLQPLWILGSSRLKRYGKHIFKWMQTDHLTLKHNKNNSPYAIFYDSITSNITFLHHIWPLSITSLIADQWTIPLSELYLEQLWNPHLHETTTDLKQIAWLKQKRKWRTLISPHQSKLERYVHTICQRWNISFSFFPSYIGLPIPNELYIASPAYLWQAWLVLQFLYQQPIGTILYVKMIEKAFRRLVDKKVIVIRIGQGQIKGSLQQYLKALERFSIIKGGENNKYTIVRTVKWQAKSLTEFCREDAAALWRWLELNV
jgi:competence protein CoiA